MLGTGIFVDPISVTQIKLYLISGQTSESQVLQKTQFILDIFFDERLAGGSQRLSFNLLKSSCILLTQTRLDRLVERRHRFWLFFTIAPYITPAVAESIELYGYADKAADELMASKKCFELIHVLSMGFLDILVYLRWAEPDGL
ncbi:unnamed protein product [Fusarium graminearum]|nr:unnamed protein product [Fusarium graminearum]